MNAVATKTEPENQVAEYSGGLLEVIARAARDPSVDIDKLERLIAVQERVEARNAKIAFTEAKIAMRPKLPSIDMRGRIVIHEKNNQNKIIQETPFARFEDIQFAIEPVLIEFGFDLTFKNGLSPDGKVRVTTILTHSAGHSDETYFDLPHDSSGSKNAVQAVGSSTKYAMRYGTVSILNLRVAGEDDDGEAGGAPHPISVKQYDELLRLINQYGAVQSKFETFMGVKALSELPASRFDEAVAAIKQKKRGG